MSISIANKEMALFCHPFSMSHTDQITYSHVKTENISPLNVLFVDDDSDESYLFNEALEHAGLSVILTNASNGNHFAEILSSEELPDLVFLDVNMPYKDGVETLVEIRKLKKYDQLPIVMYSTTKVADTINACYNAGANLFVVKPEDIDGMVKVVNKICTIDWKNFNKLPREEFVITVD